MDFFYAEKKAICVTCKVTCDAKTISFTYKKKPFASHVRNGIIFRYKKVIYITCKLTCVANGFFLGIRKVICVPRKLTCDANGIFSCIKKSICIACYLIYGANDSYFAANTKPTQITYVLFASRPASSDRCWTQMVVPCPTQINDSVLLTLR